MADSTKTDSAAAVAPANGNHSNGVAAGAAATSSSAVQEQSKPQKGGKGNRLPQILVSLGFVFLELWFLYVALLQALEQRDFFNKNPENYKVDPSWGSVNSPWSFVMREAPAFQGTLLYLAVVFSGIQFMKNREPYVVDGLMIVYNLYQTLFNFVSVCGFIYVVVSEAVPIAGKKFEPSPQNDSFWLGFLLYLHYQNKYLELFDTMFMILRKKNDQISFLHVEHHTIMVGVWYIVLRNQPGGDCWFGAFANSVIHTLMYAYYFMSLVQIPCPWKKFLTQLQLIQFVACLCQALYVIYQESTPRWLASVQIAVMINMLVLFSDFYMKKYAKSSGKTEKKD